MEKKLSQAGFSFVELILVVVIIAVLAAIALPRMWSRSKYAAEDQAKTLIDIFDEARQKALNQRKTFRVEINKTKNELRLIDEGDDATVATDDKILKKSKLNVQVTIGAPPSNVTGAPTTTSPVSVPTYATSTYPLSSGDEKITLRFKRNGQVVDTGTDNIGTGSQPAGAKIFLYSKSSSGGAPDVIRAVTVLETTGDTSLYKCTFVSSSCTNWRR